MVTIPKSELFDLISRGFQAAGLHNADTIAVIHDHLMQNEISGKRSHGLLRVKWCIDYIRKNGASDQKPSLALDLGGLSIVDGQNNLGLVAARYAADVAIEKAKKRLGALAEKVTWVCSDVTEYQANTTFDLWHDRACLHFLTQESDLKLYKERVVSSISPKGTLILGTFSKTGPEKCSGLPIHQYDNAELTELFSDEFESVENFETVHITPSKATQNYVFCRLKKK